MNQDDGKPTPLWLRLCGTVVGAILTALGAAALLFLGQIFHAAPAGLNVLVFIVVLGSAGAFVGFLLPRQTLNSLWFLLPGFSD
jgi:hypothetical protein